MDKLALIFAFIVAIVLIGTFGDVMKERLKARYAARMGTDDEEEAYLERLARLEERVEVLERIVTDERRDLRRRIDSL